MLGRVDERGSGADRWPDSDEDDDEAAGDGDDVDNDDDG